MPTRSDAPGASFPDDAQPQEGLTGGADAVEKTTYVLGKGTEPEARRGLDEPAPEPAASGVRVMLVAVVLVVAGGLIYLLAFR